MRKKLTFIISLLFILSSNAQTKQITSLYNQKKFNEIVTTYGSKDNSTFAYKELLMVGLSYIQIQEPNLDKTFFYFDKAISKEPNNLEAYSLKKDLLLQLNRIDEAITLLEKAVTLKNSDDLKFTLANLYPAVKKHDKSISILKNLSKKHPKEFSIISVLNKNYSVLGKQEQARLLTTNYMKTYGESVTSLLELANLTGEFSKAERENLTEQLSLEKGKKKLALLKKALKLSKGKENYFIVLILLAKEQSSNKLYSNAEVSYKEVINIAEHKINLNTKLDIYSSMVFLSAKLQKNTQSKIFVKRYNDLLKTNIKELMQGRERHKFELLLNETKFQNGGGFNFMQKIYVNTLRNKDLEIIYGYEFKYDQRKINFADSYHFYKYPSVTLNTGLKKPITDYNGNLIFNLSITHPEKFKVSFNKTTFYGNNSDINEVYTFLTKEIERFKYEKK